MFKKKYNDNLFECLDWILKKTLKDPSTIQMPSSFIVNRWLSMVDSSFAQIVNATSNRWLNKTDLYKNSLFAAQFYRIILPKYTGRLSYIKKKQKENTQTEESNFNTQLEMSQREIDLYNQTLDEMKSLVK
jgi:glutaredoxin 2